MHIQGTPESVYWGKKGFRDAVAKVAGITSQYIQWYRVSNALVLAAAAQLLYCTMQTHHKPWIL